MVVLKRRKNHADDITISGDQELSVHIEEIKSIIGRSEFSINDNKTHYMREKHQKKVTGLVVTDKVKIPLKYKKKLRQEIYYCKRLGVKNHLIHSMVKNTDERIPSLLSYNVKSVNFREYMYGKAYYIKMIEPAVGDRFLNELDELFL
ncbi:MAG: hypothetical protein ILA15_08825 [Clostridiales bacterium]|nr:hypothetical protein [Clostridiales bacterium]